MRAEGKPVTFWTCCGCESSEDDSQEGFVTPRAASHNPQRLQVQHSDANETDQAIRQVCKEKGVFKG